LILPKFHNHVFYINFEEYKNTVRIFKAKKRKPIAVRMLRLNQKTLFL